MGHERWFRGQHDGQSRPFDWLTPARQHGIPWQRAQALYEQAVQKAHGAAPGRVQEIYLALLADTRRDASRPSPGKITRTMRLEAERAGKKRGPRVSQLTSQPIVPGNRTLTSYIEPARDARRRAPDEQRPAWLSEQDTSMPGTPSERWLQAHLAAALGHFEERDALGERILETLVHLSGHGGGAEMPEEVRANTPTHLASGQYRLASLRGQELPTSRRSPGTGLPGDPDVVFERATSGSPSDVPYRDEMELAFGAEFSLVRVHLGRDATLAGLGARAATRGEEIAFAAAVPERELVAHELAHVLQARRGGSTSSEDRVSRPGDPAEEEAARAAREVTAGLHPAQFSRPARRQSVAADAQIRLDRQPDVSYRGLHTFYVGFGGHGRVMALQLGLSPGDARVTLKVASLSRGLLNPDLPLRTMPVSIHRSAPLRPRLVSEQQNEIQQSRHAESHECIMELALNDDPAIPHITIISRYGRARAMAPVPSESLGGAHRPVTVESGFFMASDGFNDISVTFQSDNPGTFWSAEYRPFVHPRLGFGYLDTTNRFYPGPMPSVIGDPAAVIDVVGEIARFGIHLIPVIGPLVMVGEALAGYSITGNRLGTLERTLLGAGAVLSVIGPVIRGTARAVEVAATADRLAASSGISRLQALQLITGARRLTPVETARIEELAQAVRSGRALAAEEQTALSRILGKLAEPQRVTTARAEVAARTGTASQAGRFTDLGTATSAEEARVGEALARGLRADVVRIPEATASGVRTGDYVINDAMAELYSPTTSSLRNILSGAAGKHKQAAILVIDLTRSSVARSEADSIAARLLAGPSAPTSTASSSSREKPSCRM
jgi:Domain of unknown function (DUF4157)/Contact-dependent growth inhibition CdiA C-terminal domain